MYKKQRKAKYKIYHLLMWVVETLDLCESLHSFPALSHIFPAWDLVLIFKPTIFKVLGTNWFWIWNILDFRKTMWHIYYIMYRKSRTTLIPNINVSIIKSDQAVSPNELWKLLPEFLELWERDCGYIWVKYIKRRITYYITEFQSDSL